MTATATTVVAPVVNYTLELLHISDQETGLTSYLDAPRLSAVVNALKAQDLFDDGIADNTLFLSSGNVLIPGQFYGASEQVYGLLGAGDILIQNALGLQAVAFGSREFDSGPLLIATQIAGVSGNVSIPGTNFPYLSCNLDFTPDATLNSLQVPKYLAPVPKRITSSVVFTVGGEKIGVVGATTPLLNAISSPGLVIALPEAFDEMVSADLDELAIIIQTEVDGLIAANTGMNKVILLSNMRLISIELALAERLKDVDIIVAGGSKARLFDSNDRVRAGDNMNGTYPIFVRDVNNKTTVVVNTDGKYKYVGRLVIGFDVAGDIIPSSYNVSVSGAYATDDVGVAILNATGTAIPDPNITNVIRQIEPLLTVTEGDIVGYSEVFLNGQRDVADDPLSMRLDGVRTQQTNLGDLSADANLWYAKATDSSVAISLRHGGGIRSSIGIIDILPGQTTLSRMPLDEVRSPNGTLIVARGGIATIDIENTLRFNNALVLVTVNALQLRSILEHGISALPIANGRMCQVGGVSFTFDTTLPVGGRIRDITITSTVPQREVLVDGVVVGDPSKTFRMVTLDFLLAGNDGYVFPFTGRQNVTIDPGGKSSLAAIGTERDAIEEFLLQFHGVATPYTAADTDRKGDQRIIDLAFALVAAPTAAPQRPRCGLFRLSIFCPFTLCGLFGRLLGLCYW